MAGGVVMDIRFLEGDRRELIQSVKFPTATGASMHKVFAENTISG
jgi:hypothetical protein